MQLTAELVRQYLDSNPAIRDSTAQWLASQGERRSVYQWVFDDMSQNPTSVHIDQMENFLNGEDPYSGDPTGAGAAQVDVPLEQALLDQVVPNVVRQVEGDAARQAEVDRLTEQTGAGFNDLRSVLDRSAITTDPTTGQPTSANLDAQRANADATSAAITAAAQEAAQAQLAALQTSVSQIQGNLSGALAERAAALQQAIGAYSQNLSTLDASQRASLAEQIAAQQQNLEASVATQRQALEEEVAALQGNASAAAQARRAAAEQQLATLRAAQAPLNDARLRAGEALATAVNLGLQSTQDQLRAEAAREGFIGGSTMQDAALGRAAIGARQDAAQAIGNARVANATDSRDIEARGSERLYSIEDVLAGETQRARDYGASTGARLTAGAAEGLRAINDSGATGYRTIADTTAANRANLGNYGASTTYADTTAGVDANLNLKNALATGTYDISTNLAGQKQNAATQGAIAKSGYFDQLYPNALNAAQITAGLPAAEAAAKTALIPYGTAGTNNALGILNWWSNQAAPPTSTAVTTTPSQTGNQIGALGANLVGAGFQLGNTSNWWKTPTAQKTGGTTAADDMNSYMSGFYS
jgi:hypothetical protein